MGVAAFANIEAQQHRVLFALPDGALLHMGHKRLQPSLLKPSRLTSACASGRRNMRGLGLPLCPGDHGAHFHKPKPHGAQPINAARVLVQPSGSTHAVGKLQTSHRDGVVHPACAVGQLQRGALARGQAGQREVMGSLGVQAEQKEAGQAVGNGEALDNSWSVCCASPAITPSRVLPDERKPTPATAPHAAARRSSKPWSARRGHVHYVVPRRNRGRGHRLYGQQIHRRPGHHARTRSQGAVLQLGGQHRASAGRWASAVFDSNEVDRLAVYIDGADEIDGQGYMIKGGGAALTREEIVAAQSAALSALPTSPSGWTVLVRIPGAGGSDSHGCAPGRSRSLPRWAARGARCACATGERPRPRTTAGGSAWTWRACRSPSHRRSESTR